MKHTELVIKGITALFKGKECGKIRAYILQKELPDILFIITILWTYYPQEENANLWYFGLNHSIEHTIHSRGVSPCQHVSSMAVSKRLNKEDDDYILLLKGFFLAWGYTGIMKNKETESRAPATWLISSERLQLHSFFSVIQNTGICLETTQLRPSLFPGTASSNSDPIVDTMSSLKMKSALQKDKPRDGGKTESWWHCLRSSVKSYVKRMGLRWWNRRTRAQLLS